MIGRAAVGALLAAGLTVAPTAAQAAAQPSYVLVAWSVGNPDSIWETPQELETFVMLDVPTLDALDAALPCGGYFQVDLYYADQDSAALIAGGLLYGPQNPKEPHAYVVGGDPWKFVTTAPCVVKPEPRPFHDETVTVDCEFVTTATRDGFYDLDFDPVGNVWTERAEPTVTAEGSSVAANLTPDVSCNPTGEQLPTLAETGPADGLFWLLGMCTLLLGGLLVAIRRVADVRPRYKRGA